MNFFTSVGKVFAFVLAYICLEDTSKGNWRMLMMLNGIVSVLGPICIYFFFFESPRFLIASAQFREGFEVMNKMGFINKGTNYK